MGHLIGDADVHVDFEYSTSELLNDVGVPMTCHVSILRNKDGHVASSN